MLYRSSLRRPRWYKLENGIEKEVKFSEVHENIKQTIKLINEETNRQLSSENVCQNNEEITEWSCSNSPKFYPPNLTKNEPEIATLSKSYFKVNMDKSFYHDWRWSRKKIDKTESSLRFELSNLVLLVWVGIWFEK